MGGGERVQRSWCWMPEHTCWEIGIHTRGHKKKSPLDAIYVQKEAPWTEKAVSELLHAKSVDTQEYGIGETKTMENFAQELVKSRSYLLESGSQIFRMVELVVVLMHSLDGTLLVETMRVGLDQRCRVRNLLPGHKREPMKSVQDTVDLLLKDVNIDPETVEMQLGDEVLVDKESKTYPGVRSIYRKQYVHTLPKRKSHTPSMTEA